MEVLDGDVVALVSSRDEGNGQLRGEGFTDYSSDNGGGLVDHRFNVDDVGARAEADVLFDGFDECVDPGVVESQGESEAAAELKEFRYGRLNIE